MSTLELENIKHPDNSGDNIALASNGSITIDRQSTDGTIIDFRKSGTNIGTIGVDNGDNLTISGNSHAGLNFSDNDINPYKNGNYADGIIDLGYTTSRFKDLHLSGGIYVGGQGSANYLDDYEEGTWTPTLTASTTNPSATYSFQVGRYTKIGNLVQVNCILETSGKSGGSGDLRISGLPFTSTNVNGTQSSGSVAFYRVDSLSAENASYVESNATFVIIRGRNGHSASDTWTNVSINGWTASNPTLIQFSVSYRTDQ